MKFNIFFGFLQNFEEKMKNEIGESNNTENGKNNMKVTPPNTVSSPGPQSSEEKPSHNLRLTVIHSEHSPSVSEDKRDENNAVSFTFNLLF